MDEAEGRIKGGNAGSINLGSTFSDIRAFASAVVGAVKLPRVDKNNEIVPYQIMSA